MEGKGMKEIYKYLMPSMPWPTVALPYDLDSSLIFGRFPDTGTPIIGALYICSHAE